MSKYLEILDKIDFSKSPDGLIPAIIQHHSSGLVLMLGYMNEEAVKKSISIGKVTFYSRSKNRLWTKGESSGNFLEFKSMFLDCDHDTLLVQADPLGPTCHTGTETCFGEEGLGLSFLEHLQQIIIQRKNNPSTTSYTASLFASGLDKIAQKVGEEAVETVIEAKNEDRDKFLNESADLLFHFLVLLQAKNESLQDVIEVLKDRHK